MRIHGVLLNYGNRLADLSEVQQCLLLFIT